jgi:hypothetical protein
VFPLLGHFQKILRHKRCDLLLVGLAFARKCLTDQSFIATVIHDREKGGNFGTFCFHNPLIMKMVGRAGFEPA